MRRRVVAIVAGAKEAEVEKDVLEKNLTFELEEVDSANESFSDCSARSFSCSVGTFLVNATHVESASESLIKVSRDS